MSDFDWPPPIDRPAILADQALEVIHERASNWVRAWDYLLLQDDPEAYAMRFGPDQSTTLIDMVRGLSRGCVDTLRTAQDPSERDRESDWRYVDRVQSKRPQLTPALRRIGRAILHARQMVITIYPKYDGPGFAWAEGMDDSQEARRAAWTELRDAKAELGAALYAPPPAEPEATEAPAASSPIDLRAIATELRKAGKEREARLVEFMSDKSEASFRDVAKAVHDMPVSDEAIKSNRLRANRSLEAMGVPLRFRVASRRVYRELPAE